MKPFYNEQDDSYDHSVYQVTVLRREHYLVGARGPEFAALRLAEELAQQGVDSFEIEDVRQIKTRG